MKARFNLLVFALIAVVALLGLSGLTAASPSVVGDTPPATPLWPPPTGEEAQTYDLGDGQYVAIIPAAPPGPDAVYNQEALYDTYVDSYNSGTTYCSSSELHVEYNESPFLSGPEAMLQTYQKRSLLGFNLSSIPTNADVTSATFYAYLFSAWGDSDNLVTISLRRVISSWTCPSWDGMPSSAAHTSESINTAVGWKS